jgi:hypothetical protein
MGKHSKKNRKLLNKNNEMPKLVNHQLGGSSKSGGNKPSSIFSKMIHGVSYFNHHVMYLNNSKFFAGVIMILLNVGSKFITIQFSKSTEEYMKYTLSKQILVFAMAWMGTRDIYTALGLTAVFTILSEHLFNEESHLCIVPHNYRVLHKLLDTNNDNIVSETEITSAIAILEKAKKEKQRTVQKEAFSKFNYKKI